MTTAAQGAKGAGEARTRRERTGKPMGTVRARGWHDYGGGVVGVQVPGMLDNWVEVWLEEHGTADQAGAVWPPDGAVEAFGKLWWDAPRVLTGRGSKRELVARREDLTVLRAVLRDLLLEGNGYVRPRELVALGTVLGRLEALGVPGLDASGGW